MRQISNYWPLAVCFSQFSYFCWRKIFFARESAADIFFTHAQIIASLLVSSVRIMWYARAARFLELAGILLQVCAFPAAWSWGSYLFGTSLLRKIPSAFVIVRVRASTESLKGMISRNRRNLHPIAGFVFLSCSSLLHQMLFTCASRDDKYCRSMRNPRSIWRKTIKMY